MKTLIATALLAAATAASAQIVAFPTATYVPYNLVANAGFETKPLWPTWDNAGSQWTKTYDGTTSWSPGGHQDTSPAHSGKGCYTLDTVPVAESPYYASVSTIHQNVSPTLGSQITSAVVWVRSRGQSLEVRVHYQDGGYTSAKGYFAGAANVYDSSLGWQKGDFTGIVAKNRVVTSVEFLLQGGGIYDSGNSVTIDDVSMTKLLKVYWP